MAMKTKRLRSMSAEVIKSGNSIIVDTPFGQPVVENYYMLKSYNSIVAIFDVDEDKLYLLPRFDYSVTTWKHLHAFINDYTSLIDLPASEIRKYPNDFDYYCAYAYANNDYRYPHWYQF